jgi:hypothetical protein
MSMKSSASNRTPASPEVSSAPYIGQWRKLVSTTNWEKGRIISEWREALEKSGAKPADYSDESWSRIVGGVTPQHVGRLRRVYDRFGKSHSTFDGIFWSHFHASLDWDDAEMWLEGAIQNEWSVSQMRRQRWETLGGEEPREEEIVLSEVNEDLPPFEGDSSMLTEIRGHRQPGEGDPSDKKEGTGRVTKQTKDDPFDTEASEKSRGKNAFGDESPKAPFSGLAPLPLDLQDAFDNLKLAILKHKINGWRDASRDDVLESLEALKELVVAPAEA